MDADRDGIPCETVYDHSAVIAFWGESLATATTRLVITYTVATHGLHPLPLPGSGGWFGSGCSPSSDALPDGIWWGFVKGLSPSSVTFDLACLRWTPDLDDDPIEGGAWDIENRNPRVRNVPVHPNALVTCGFWGCPRTPFSYTDWIEDDSLPHGEEESGEGIWLYINDGKVAEIGHEVLAG
jgi:hypothetical protein